MRKNVIIALSLILIGFIGLFIVKKVEEKKQNQPVEKQVAVVKVITPKIEEIDVYYTANSNLQAKISAILKPQVAGRIIKLNVEEGQFVKTGQVLAVIEPDKQDIQIESQLSLINQLENVYINKKSIYERRKQLYEKELISKEEFENSKTDMEVALNQLNQAKANLKEFSRQKRETLIKAPFDGYVGKRMINVGDYVDTQTQTFYILKLNPIWAVFQLPQQYIKNINVGSIVKVEIDGFETTDAKVEYISPSLTQNNLFEVKAVIDNKDGALKENMYAKVKIVIQKEKGFKIPEEAVQLAGNESFILLARNSKAVKVPVKVLDQGFGYVYIAADINPDDKVIVSNIMNLKDGMSIKVMDEVK